MNIKIPIGLLLEMAYPKNRKATLLGEYFNMLLGYTLTAYICGVIF